MTNFAITFVDYIYYTHIYIYIYLYYKPDAHPPYATEKMIFFLGSTDFKLSLGQQSQI